MGMTDPGEWQPPVKVLRHPLPRQMTALAAALEVRHQSRPMACRKAPMLRPFRGTP